MIEHEFTDAPLADKRLAHRLVKIAAMAVTDPAASFPQMARSDGEDFGTAAAAVGAARSRRLCELVQDGLAGAVDPGASFAAYSVSGLLRLWVFSEAFPSARRHS